jgi:hypothetical protein
MGRRRGRPISLLISYHCGHRPPPAPLALPPPEPDPVPAPVPEDPPLPSLLPPLPVVPAELPGPLAEPFSPLAPLLGVPPFGWSLFCLCSSRRSCGVICATCTLLAAWLTDCPQACAVELASGRLAAPANNAAANVSVVACTPRMSSTPLVTRTRNDECVCAFAPPVQVTNKRRPNHCVPGACARRFAHHAAGEWHWREGSSALT